MSDIHTARMDFLASLRVRNNLEDEDVGVNSILDALNTEDPRKAIRHSRTIRMKEQLEFLAFIDHLSISEAQRMYRGVRVADLTETIINKVISFSHIILCNTCLNLIYVIFLVSYYITSGYSYGYLVIDINF